MSGIDKYVIFATCNVIKLSTFGWPHERSFFLPDQTSWQDFNRATLNVRDGTLNSSEDIANYYYYYMIYIAPISRIESEALASLGGEHD